MWGWGLIVGLGSGHKSRLREDTAIGTSQFDSMDQRVLLLADSQTREVTRDRIGIKVSSGTWKRWNMKKMLQVEPACLMGITRGSLLHKQKPEMKWIMINVGTLKQAEGRHCKQYHLHVMGRT